MKNIVLIGYRCTGKSSVGNILARRLKRPFWDTDGLITEQSQMSIDELVSIYGWEYFRMREKKIVRKVSRERGSVIATGGGVLEDHENAETLKKGSVVVWLSADIDTIMNRMKSDPGSAHKRPSLSQDDPFKEVQNIMKRREPGYRRSADFIIDTSRKDIESTADEICSFLERDYTCQATQQENSLQ